MAQTRSRTLARNLAHRDRPATFRYPPFKKSLPMLLLAAREAVTHRFRRLIKLYSLTEQQWRVLRALAEVESLEIAVLAARCRIHSASLSRMLPKLAADGLIARCANAADHRRVIVSLLPPGRRLLDLIMPEGGRVYEQIARDVGPERLARTYAMLEEFVALLDAAKPGAPAPRRVSLRFAQRQPARRKADSAR